MIFRPTRSGLMSRTMVSTSGSSGIQRLCRGASVRQRELSGGFAPADIPPERLSLELNGLGGLATELLGLGKAGTHPGDGEHPAAIDPKRPVGSAPGAGMKDGDRIRQR